MRLSTLVEELAEIVGGLEPDAYTGADAARLAALFDRAERLSAAGKAISARRAAECGEWSRQGARSAEQWLAGLWGTEHSSAQAALNTALAATSDPRLDEALRTGEVSAIQAGHIARAAAGDPTATDRLVHSAKTRSLKGFKADCRQVAGRAASAWDDEERAKRLRQGGYLRTWSDQDGAGRIAGRLDPLSLAELKACLVPFETQVFDAARAEGRRESFEAYRADALVEMARAATASPIPPGQGSTPARESSSSAGEAFPAAAGSTPSPTSPTTPAGGPSTARDHGRGCPSGYSDTSWLTLDGGDSSAPRSVAGAPSEDPSATPRPHQPETVSCADGQPGSGRSPGASADGSTRRGRRLRVEVIAVIDVAALARGYALGEERCYIEDVGPVPVAVVRDMTASACIAAVLTDGVDIRSGVHLGRHPTRLQKTALRVRDPHCVVPGRDVSENLQVDHLPEWEQTHHTTLDELARECAFHHRQRTYDGAALSGSPGDWQWSPPPPGPFDDPVEPITAGPVEPVSPTDPVGRRADRDHPPADLPTPLRLDDP